MLTQRLGPVGRLPRQSGMVRSRRDDAQMLGLEISGAVAGSRNFPFISWRLADNARREIMAESDTDRWIKSRLLQMKPLIHDIYGQT